MITKSTLQLLLVLGALSTAAASTAQTVVLSNGSSVTGIAGATGDQKYYRLYVPGGQNRLQFRIFGGTGDCDLYVRYGAPPTTSVWDYRPYVPGSNETVNISNPVSGDWYVMLKSFSSYTGESLQGTYSLLLQNGKLSAANSGAIGSQKYYRLPVPLGQSKLYIGMGSGTGDSDLYVRRGAPPTTAIWDYRPYLSGNVESVTINNPLSGDWYMMLKGFNSYSGVYLKATSTVILGKNQIVNGISAPLNAMKFYQIVVPAGQSVLDISIRNGTGDCDLYVKRGSLPTLSNWDYRPLRTGNEELVTVFNPTPGTWYIMLRAFQPFTGVTLQANYFI